MEKKEFVQRFIIENENALGSTDEKINRAIKVFDMIEEKFRHVPTTNLWDYNDMQR